MAIDEDFSKITDGNINGDGYFDVLMKSVKSHIQEEFSSERIKGLEYSRVYLGSLQACMQIAADFAIRDRQTDIAENESAYGLNEKAEKWTIQKPMMENQKSSSDIDLSFKQEMSQADLDTKEKTLESMDADIDYNLSKKDVMEATRKDNIRMKASEQFAEFLKYISAADVVPSEIDFQNMRELTEAVIGGVEDPDTTVFLDTPTISYQNK